MSQPPDIPDDNDIDSEIDDILNDPPNPNTALNFLGSAAGILLSKGYPMRHIHSALAHMAVAAAIHENFSRRECLDQFGSLYDDMMDNIQIAFGPLQ